MAAPPAPDMAAFSGQGQVAVGQDPSMKLTRGHSCVLCQQRKVRCDKNKPCANCVKAGVDCRVVPPQPPRRRKKKPHERELIDRLKKYESLLSQHGVDFEPISQVFKPSDQSLDEVDELEHGIEGLKTSPSSTGQDIERHPKWFPYDKHYRNQEGALRDLSDDSSDGPIIHQAFDKMFDGTDGFPFVIGGSMASVTELHPPAVQIFQLWQIYLDNVNPLLKITHTPTLQGQLIEAAANPSKIPKPLEALMFSIYFIATISMTDDEVQETLKEDRNRLLSKFHRGSQQALVNAGFMRSPDIVVLQAYVMYLLCVRQFVDPRALFCLIGMAVRIANRLGLHLDAEQFSIPPFEVELRRRLWWQLAIFDKRIAEITGSNLTALSTSNGDCKWPLNVNDTDLHVNAKDRITPYVGPTEMLYCLTRFELTVAANPDGKRPVQNPKVASSLNKPKYQYSPSPASSDVFTSAVNHNLPSTNLDSYVEYIEETYLKHCDSKIPLHLFTFLNTRLAISKLRIIDYVCCGYAQQHPDPTALPPGPDRALRESVVEEAIRVIEYDNMIQAHEALQGFKWMTLMHFPLPAFIFLVSDLRYITKGETCERAWGAIDESHERRKMKNNQRSPMYNALGKLILKAWDCHEAAEAQAGRAVSPLPIVIAVREWAQKNKSTANRETASGNRVGVNTTARSASSAGTTADLSYTVSRPQPQQPHLAEMDIRSAGSSPPMVSGPGGGMDPMAGAMFGTGFDGLNQSMFSSNMMQGDLGLGGMMDWSSMAPSSWGNNGYMGGGGYEYPNAHMAHFHGPGPGHR